MIVGLIGVGGVVDHLGKDGTEAVGREQRVGEVVGVIPDPCSVAVALLDRHLHLALGAETGQSRLATGAYQFWRAHVGALVRQAGIGGPDALADLLLAPLAPEVYRYQRDTAGLANSRIVDALTLMAERLLAEGTSPPRRGRRDPGTGAAPVRQRRVKRT